jgi:hypothetical protein
MYTLAVRRSRALADKVQFACMYAIDRLGSVGRGASILRMT